MSETNEPGSQHSGQDEPQGTQDAPQASAPQPAKKAARTAAKKVTVIMAGTSYGASAGDRQQVDADRAEELVRAGLARYPGKR